MTREDELFRRLRGGDGAALEELIIDAYPAILRYCLWHTPDRQTAEDAAQETFLKAVRHLDAYAHRGKFRAYLYKIAANTCTDLRRRNGRPEPLGPEEYIEPGFEQVEAELSVMQLGLRAAGKAAGGGPAPLRPRAEAPGDRRGPGRAAPHRAVPAALGVGGPQKSL